MGQQPDIGQLVAILSVAFAATTTVIGFLIRQLLKSYREQAEQKFLMLDSKIKNVDTDQHECEDHFNKREERLEELFEKLRDRWERFVQEDSIMEATRGRKVDALFEVVDRMKIEIQQLKPATFAKLNDLYARAQQELRMEIRDYIAQTLQTAGKR